MIRPLTTLKEVPVLIILLKIGYSALLVAGFSVMQTTLVLLVPRLDLAEFRDGLYLWALMFWFDIVGSSVMKTWRRATAVILYLGLAYALWLIWEWSIWVFLPAFVLVLPIFWMIGAAIVIASCALFPQNGTPPLPSRS